MNILKLLIKTIRPGNEVLDNDTYIKKHQNLVTIICCPNCHSDVTFQNADFFLDIPIAGALSCQKCGDVGKIANLKFLFTPENLPPANTNRKQYSGELTVSPLLLTSSYFAPVESWDRNGEQFYSSQENARFSLQCNSLAISLVFLKHPWAGITRILIDGNIVGTLDLFEEKGSLSIWYPIYLDGKDHLIEVEVTGKKNPQSNDVQIFIVGVETLKITHSNEPKISYMSRNDGNPYPDCFKKLIADVADDGLILDCGSGDRSYPDSRVINFEYSMFRSPDIFGDGHKLPFKENSFDLVLSQAVIEHLYDPGAAVLEILRVLKPGGVVYAESAFIQPLHAVPYHYFNTTSWGLEHLFRKFQIVSLGHEGQLGDTLTWFYNLTALRDKGLGDKLDKLLGIVKELDAHITSEELKCFSSYVTVLASKCGVAK